jgi:hypothetical protein
MPKGVPLYDLISSTELLADLVALDSRPWSDWKAGRPMTAKALANELKPFDIFPSSDGARRGYSVRAMADAFARYLPPQPVNVSETQQPSRLSTKINVSNQIVTDTSNNSQNPLGTAASDTLTRASPVLGLAGELSPEGWTFNTEGGQ